MSVTYSFDENDLEILKTSVRVACEKKKKGHLTGKSEANYQKAVKKALQQHGIVNFSLAEYKERIESFIEKFQHPAFDAEKRAKLIETQMEKLGSKTDLTLKEFKDHLKKFKARLRNSRNVSDYIYNFLR
jgi:ribosomal protein L11 methylase PrmA